MRISKKNEMNINSRDYENILPECGSPTIVSIKDSNEMGIYVSLLEFDEIEGLLLFSEVSRRRIRSLSKLIKKGKKEIVSVIRVDNDKSYIDVSKRQISEIEVNYMKKKRNFGKIVNLISNNFSRVISIDFEEIKLRWIWLLSRKYSHAIKALKFLLKFPNTLFTNIDLKKNQLSIFSKNLKKKMPINVLKIEVEFEINYFLLDGIKTIKSSINSIKKISLFSKINCKTQVPPRYTIIHFGNSKKKIVQMVSKFLYLVSKKILSKKGVFRIINITFN
jgi:translation initiation factor 2 subunit 1